ncbi:MAG: hypothetical protein E2P02_26360 [Acidobacteria bacterium]|nr:MAG: hypothetical protein E2P02_26360 [Acidobacteriota bacterium]
MSIEWGEELASTNVLTAGRPERKDATDFRFELLPQTRPSTIRVGEDWLFRLTPPASCQKPSAWTVEWQSDRPDVVFWLAIYPPGAQKTGSILEPVSSGLATISVRMCRENGAQCQVETFELEVID